MVPLNKGNCRLIVATLLEAKKGEAEGKIGTGETIVAAFVWQF